MFENVEIRRIREADAGAVVEMWDLMCRAVRDGGPLTPAGRGHLARMLAVTAWHHSAFCLVAADGDRLVGFGLGRLDTGDGLLPEVVGEIQEVYGPPVVRRRLAQAVIERLGTPRLRVVVAADEPADHQFWAGLGFEADMVVMSRYEG